MAANGFRQRLSSTLPRQDVVEGGYTTDVNNLLTRRVRKQGGATAKGELRGKLLLWQLGTVSDDRPSTAIRPERRRKRAQGEN